MSACKVIKRQTGRLVSPKVLVFVENVPAAVERHNAEDADARPVEPTISIHWNPNPMQSGVSLCGRVTGCARPHRGEQPGGEPSYRLTPPASQFTQPTNDSRLVKRKSPLRPPTSFLMSCHSFPPFLIFTPTRTPCA